MTYPRPLRTARPEAKDTGPSNRKPINPPSPRQSRALGEGGAGRGACPPSPAEPAPPHGRARAAPASLSLCRRVLPPGGCGRWGPEEKPAPCAAAVRNPVVTIIIPFLILNDVDHYYLFTLLDYTMYLGSGLTFCNGAPGRSGVPWLRL